MYQFKLPNGIILYKWPHKQDPTEDLMKMELDNLGFKAYDLQTCPPWFERSMHAHDYEEIRAAVSGCITFHFSEFPITIEAGDIVIIPAGIPHEAITHNSKPFTAFKGSRSGVRSVTEYGDAKGSIEDLQKQKENKA
ncbi:cupin domain-containing protein [Fluviispira multicolorata]|uniref:Cupin domain-containing protein n=1 Tax=Fluviispira multicolorata TaxID=2654512 RepID=A0A833JCX6_9BACT|nr:cupin domain-containing protein [Fluviispira multicolorata]KAB8030986.1 cupin domain-containing protein [Fluviispira multicolorata]